MDCIPFVTYNFYMDYSRKTAIIVCHDAMFGPPHELRDYLLNHHIKQLLFIGHPNKTMYDNAIRSSYFEYYKNGKLVKTYKAPAWNLPELVGYAKDCFWTLVWSVGIVKGTADYFIGLGNVNACCGLLFKMLGLSTSVYYYVIDYIPNRFANQFVNLFYHWLEKTAALYCTATWNYAPAMMKEREQKWHRIFPHQIIVPNGVHIRKQNIATFEHIHRHELIYLGTLTKQQGIQLVLRALPAVKKKITDMQFSIIGKGIYQKTLETLAKKLGISECVTFLGFIEDPVEVDKRIGQAALGIATYDPELSFVIYTEPGKVKRYLSVGVPVLMTNVSPLAKILEKKSCGLVCHWDTEEVKDSIISFLSDVSRQKRYRRNAVSYARAFTWEKIFTDAFVKSTIDL